MANHIFQIETELQNIPEAAPKASRSFSVSEKWRDTLHLHVREEAGLKRTSYSLIGRS
jgi:hypothetical protein